MVTQDGAPRSYTSQGQQLAGAPAADYAAAWRMLMGMATPEMKAMMLRALAKARGNT